ncbi:MAG TPA: ParB/RepB/Spo0J family partition protein [Novosphingobium sp.]|nr:ParB/RepB/Spo0J family partition protein [Novosphingobium sp.]
MSTGFKKRAVDPGAVAQAQALAAVSPLVAAPVGTAPAALPESAVGPRPAAANLGSIQDGGAYQVGQTYEVPLGLVKSNPVNPKALYTASAVDEMTLSMQAHGQISAAQGYVDGPNVVLIEGETRLRASRALGRPTLRIEIKQRPESEQQLYEEARAANKERRDGSPLDDAIRWKDLLARKVYASQAAIAKALGLGEDEVSRTMQLTQLSQRVLMALGEEPTLLTGRMLNAIREFHGAAQKAAPDGAEDATIDLIQEAAKNGLGYRDVLSRRKQIEAGPVKRPRASAEQLTYGGVKGELKLFEEGGRMELSFKGLKPEQATELREKIKQVFASAA